MNVLTRRHTHDSRVRAAAVAFANALVIATVFACSAAVDGAQAQTIGSVEYAVSIFDGSVDPWHVASLELSHRTPRGTGLVRGNVARRFGETGEQVEVELYPRIGAHAYALLGAGVASSELFPSSKFAAELFHPVGAKLEMSIGARYLDFDARSVTLFTGSIAGYPRGYYVALRPFLSSDRGDRQLSADLLIRRYMADELHWIALRIGGGRVPNETITPFELERLRSIHASFEGRIGLHRNAGLRWTIGGEREELPADQIRNRITTGLGLEVTLR